MRALTIMAAIERGEGSSDEVVRGWLTKALPAPRGPQWVCDKCSLPSIPTGCLSVHRVMHGHPKLEGSAAK